MPDLACGDPGSGNLIVQGDNLVALKALLPYYAGQVKCISIDTPYNTGNEGWAYNDNVNSLTIGGLQEGKHTGYTPEREPPTNIYTACNSLLTNYRHGIFLGRGNN